MVQEQRTASPTPIDLSEEIALTVEKQPADRVRCTRISVDTYRCNWWAPEAKSQYDNPTMSGLLVTTHRVRKSRFLRVTKTAAGLVINGMTPAPVTI